MPRFFIENGPGEPVHGEAEKIISIIGDDAHHISRSLRMKPGERLTVCDTAGMEYRCEIISAYDSEALLRVMSAGRSQTEPDVTVTLYQGYPKGDKLESVIEKSVELGVFQIVPVLTERSIARPDEKSAARKLEKWQRRALEAAKQCGRGRIPEVHPLIDFSRLPERMSRHELGIYFYELGGSPLREIILCKEATKPRDIAVFIGPEGGISAREAELLSRAGVTAATLGRRILRTETAPVAALAAIMLLTGNLD